MWIRGGNCNCSGPVYSFVQVIVINFLAPLRVPAGDVDAGQLPERGNLGADSPLVAQHCRDVDLRYAARLVTRGWQGIWCDVITDTPDRHSSSADDSGSIVPLSPGLGDFLTITLYPCTTWIDLPLAISGWISNFVCGLKLQSPTCCFSIHNTHLSVISQVVQPESVGCAKWNGVEIPYLRALNPSMEHHSLS